MKYPAPQCLVGQLAEPAFDEIEPRRRRRGEVELEWGMFVQPRADVVVLVGGVIVQDQVNPQLGGDLAVDGAQELHELLMTVPGQAPSDDRAGEHVKGGK